MVKHVLIVSGLDPSGGAVLITGGHLAGASAVDVLADDAGTREFSAPRVPGGENVHGTGCALSTAIACGLAAGHNLDEAIAAAKRFVASKLRDPAQPGRGSPSVI